jgi:hypothetical protein
LKKPEWLHVLEEPVLFLLAETKTFCFGRSKPPHTHTNRMGSFNRLVEKSVSEISAIPKCEYSGGYY